MKHKRSVIRKVKALSHSGAYVTVPTCLIGKEVIVIDVAALPQGLLAKVQALANLDKKKK